MIITLCGSTRFYKTFDNVMLSLARKGILVFTIGSHRGKDTDKYKVRGFPVNQGIVNVMVNMHERKIMYSDAIFVIDVNGYVGSHTKHEIIFATRRGIPVYYYSKGDLKRILSFELKPRKEKNEQ